METNNNLTSTDKGKSTATISYITIIGWLIAYFGMYKENKTTLSTYHLRQSLLLHLVMIAINIALTIINMILLSSVLGYLGLLLWVAYLIFMIVGAMAANNGQQKPLPFLGDKAQGMFPSI